MSDPIHWYETNADSVVARYEALQFPEVHGWLMALLPEPPARILDIGAGSGRDAAWLASRGHDVIAVEPSAAMRQAGTRQHAGAFGWLNDRLPSLDLVTRSGQSFDLILVSAVWMHLPQRDRHRAFRKMVNLLKPGGLLAMSLRIGAADPQRGIHAVGPEEVEALARDHGAFVELHDKAADLLGRRDISWIRLAIRLPDDGTGALPLLRHVILNDVKSSTYKLAMLRVLCRIADGSAGLAREHDDEFTAIPLGLVSLTWLRLFWPLVTMKLPQTPTNDGLDGLGFAKEPFRELLGHGRQHDLRAGMVFAGEPARYLHQALRDAANNIAVMPATHTTYPNGEPVFPVRRRSPGRIRARFQLDHDYLSLFGDLLIPRHLWMALQRYSVWVEPAIIAEWTKLITHYAARQEREAEIEQIARAMEWHDPQRCVKLARERAKAIMVDAGLHCVWTGKRLSGRTLDVDHCLPWSAWPCGDLWNLMPAHRDVNQRQKRDKLPAYPLLRHAQDRVISWWDAAYEQNPPGVSSRFRLEAMSSLPGITNQDCTLDEIFDALCLQRMRLKHDQRVPEWKAWPS